MLPAPIPPRSRRPAVGHCVAAGLGLLLGLVAAACQPPRVIYVFEKPAAEPAQASPPEKEEPVAEPAPTAPPDYEPFELRPEPEVECEVAERIDVNLGHAPQALVRAAHCQIAGEPAPDGLVAEWADELRTDRFTRRIDVVRALCAEHDPPCELVYSDPWKEQVELSGAPERAIEREVGAVLLFFFHCPDDTNCKMNWANTHAVGMNEKHPLLGFGDEPDGYYVPDNPGFWRRELLDAQWAGLTFVMPNVYGPDIEDGKLAPLVTALESIDDPPKVAMFDDTWTWGEPWFSDFWKQKPDLNDPEAAARRIYDAKWKPFFSQIDEKYWYRFDGRPFIYFYNAGKLSPRSQSAPVVSRMKELFQADFGEEPFVVVDKAYFEDARMKEVADSEFQWFTFQLPDKKSRSRMNGHVIDHAMVRWDAVGRDRPGERARRGDLLIKDGAVLRKVLDESRDADVLVIATWNDLGEGTGINRNYDYYAHGHWLPPHHFMRMIRSSQAGR